MKKLRNTKAELKKRVNDKNYFIYNYDFKKVQLL